MLVNDVLESMLGVRLVRNGVLERMGYYGHRPAMKRFRQDALAAVQVMERFNGRTLTPALKRKADEYARELLGGREYAPWLYVYATMQGTFHEGWIPDDFYHLVVVPKVDRGLAPITAMKSFSNIVLKTEALPDIAYHIGGIFYDRGLNRISRQAMLALAKPYDTVFVKRDGGGQGANVKRIETAALADHVFDGDAVLQRSIRQHGLLEEIVAGAVSTLRITTAVAPDGAIDTRGAFLRVAHGGRAWVMDDSAIEIAVLDAQGALASLGYGADWRALDRHPDTGVVFKGRYVPAFEAAARLCLGLHAKVPHLPVIGWDVAINSDEGVELIEWNGGHGDIKFCEAVSGPHYRDMKWERFAKRV